MEARDRLSNFAVLGAAVVVWVLVALIVTTRDPVAEPVAGFIGAALIGLAVALTLTPLFWLVVFARHRRIAYRGDWWRALRRGVWVGAVVAVFVIMRLNGIFQLPIGLFLVGLAIVAEVTLTAGGANRA